MDFMNTMQDVQQALQQARSKQEFQRVLCVWLKLSFGLTSKEVGAAIGRTPEAVRRIQAQFAREGVQAFLIKKKGGRRREYISFSREVQILSKFVHRARRGFPLNIEQVRKAYELSVGNPVSRSTVYRLITRHGLRRFLPRARRT